MRKLLSLTVAAGLALAALASGASAQPYQQGPGYGPPPYHHDHGGPGWRHWNRGDRYYGHREVVGDWYHHNLRRPPGGYEWVNDGGQFVLIGIASGVIADAIINGR